MGVVRSAECERAGSWVSLALDGELSELEEASLRAHVGRCAACAVFERDLDALTRELRAAPLERPVAAGVASHGVVPHSRSAARRVLQLSAAAAAVALAAGLGSLAGSLSSRHAAVLTVARAGGGSYGAVLDRGGHVAELPAPIVPAGRSRSFLI